MITLPAVSKTQNLQYPTSNTSDEMYERLDRAVEAYAADKDLLNKLLEVDTFDNTLQLMSALDWLVDRAPFDMALISTNRGALKYFNERLNGDARSVWIHNIHVLAMGLIRRNYDQGWQEDNRHPVFSLRFPSVYAADEGEHFELGQLYRQRHWPLFVQAVMVKDWFQVNCTMRADAGPEATERAAAFITGVVDVLASSYPTLGQYRDGRYHRVSSRLSQARPSWHYNIEQAANALDAQRRSVKMG